MSWTIIYLGTTCRRAQATYLKRDGPPHCFYPVLLRMGFTCALSVTAEAVVSYTAFPPLRRYGIRRGLFLLHWPGSHLHRTLSGILPYEARTFLVCCLSHLHPRLSVLLNTVSDYTIFLLLRQQKSVSPSAAEVASRSHLSF